MVASTRIVSPRATIIPVSLSSCPEKSAACEELLDPRRHSKPAQQGVRLPGSIHWRLETRRTVYCSRQRKTDDKYVTTSTSSISSSSWPLLVLHGFSHACPTKTKFETNRTVNNPILSHRRSCLNSSTEERRKQTGVGTSKYRRMRDMTVAGISRSSARIARRCGR